MRTSFCCEGKGTIHTVRVCANPLQRVPYLGASISSTALAVPFTTAFQYFLSNRNMLPKSIATDVTMGNLLGWGYNPTCTTRMSSPVSALSCSRTCLAGFGLSL